MLRLSQRKLEMSSACSIYPLLTLHSVPAVRSSAAVTSAKNPIEEEKKTYPIRLPRSVQAAFLQPLKWEARYGIPSCDLQLRSYSVRNLEFMADFAMRAAYYLRLPASGPIPLPQKVERWTVIRGNFVHKKSQENFERKTLRRLIQIKDGHPQTVQAWLAYLRKHAFYGVGMKANVWEYEPLNVNSKMDRSAETLDVQLQSKMSKFGRNVASKESRSITDILERQKYRQMGVPLTEVREKAREKDEES